MKTLRTAAIALFMAPLLLTAVTGRTAARSPDAGQKSVLAPQYKKWLDEEVFYLITRTERDVFLKLQTDKERDMFIEAFWKQRDPTPNTPDNEFKTEHYRRLDYANRFLGRDSTRPGWLTDRGRIYIILGAPNDIQKFEGGFDVVPTEVWFYQGKTDLGLPPAFNMVFFKDQGHGEFRLYSPATDGPMALMTGMRGDIADFSGAYKALKDKEPNLAAVSISLIPGEESTYLDRPSLSSDVLIQKVESTPQRQVQVSYAEKFLKYKDIVDVEYSANYLDSESLVKVFRDASGISFIHFALEPRRLSVNQYEDKFYSTLNLNGSLALADGKIIYQYDRTIDLRFDEGRMREIGGLPFDIQDIIPVVPGEYRLSVLVKNDVSKEFSTLEQTVRISPPGSGPQLAPPLLGYKLAKLDAAQQKRRRAFQFGEAIVYCQPNRVFLSKDTLVVALQVFGLGEAIRPKADVRFAFLRDNRLFKERVRPAADLTALPNVIEEIPLADFPPAHYALQVSLLIDGVEAAGSGEEFDVTYVEAVPRPWAHSRVLPEGDSPVYSHILGVQLAKLGRPDEALTYLTKANRQKPDDLETATALAQIYLTRGEFANITALVEPFLSQEKPAYEILYLAGQAYLGTGQFARAEAVLGKAATRYGVNTNLLNALGECYQGQGRTDEALASWRKSLEFDGNQPEIKHKVEALTKKD